MASLFGSRLTDVGGELLARARAIGAASLAVVGTSKNVGKTVVVRAVCDALGRSVEPFGLLSIGRDGESNDVLESSAKPRLWLREGALIATARALVASHPASEIVDVTAERSALGPIVIARVRIGGWFEIAGPAQASGVRRIVRALHEHGAAFVAIDGAIDRIAALRDGDDAIVIATGASAGPTQTHVVDDVGAFAARLRTRAYDPARPFVLIDGALSASRAAELVRAGEDRQVVVADPTRISFGGKLYFSLARRLRIRCERPLAPIACTTASIGVDRRFEPRSFMRAVADATGMPTFDVYASAMAS